MDKIAGSRMKMRSVSGATNDAIGVGWSVSRDGNGTGESTDDNTSDGSQIATVTAGTKERGSMSERQM